MLHSILFFFILLSIPQEKYDILPAFRDALVSGDGLYAVTMISENAIRTVDSVLTHNPEQFIQIVSYFGIEPDLSNMENTGVRQILTEIFSNPSVSGAVLILGVSSGEPFISGERTFVPVEWGFPGSKDTMYIEIIEEDSLWKIDDFFDRIPGIRS